MVDKSVYYDSTGYGDYLETSVKTPGFNRLVQLGLPLPNKAYHFERYDAKDPKVLTWNGTRNERDAGGLCTFNRAIVVGGYILYGAQDKGLMTVDRIHAIVSNKLASKARNSPIDLGVSLGEYRETAELVEGAMRKTAGLYRAVRKFDFSEALRVVTGRRNRKFSDAAHAAADAWLGFTYGVKPLMRDVYGAMDALSSKDDQVVVHVVRASVSECFRDSAETSACKGNVTGQIKASGKFTYRVDNPLLFTLDQLGVINPIALTWELIPFSFVVDWFIPIGNFLRGVVPPPGISQVSGYTYVKAKGRETRATDLGLPGSDGWHTSLVTREIYKDRRIFTGFPNVTLVVPDLSLTKSQLMSGISLLVNLLHR